MHLGRNHADCRSASGATLDWSRPGCLSHRYASISICPLYLFYSRCLFGIGICRNLHNWLDPGLLDLWADGGHQEFTDVSGRLPAAYSALSDPPAVAVDLVDRCLLEFECRRVRESCGAI